VIPMDFPIITLTTDFGLSDDYVGTLKGAILCSCRQANIVDLTHAIAPQDIAGAADSIGHCFRFFPKGTVHLVIVDPGVGSQRRILALRAADHLFVAPDNGVLTRLLTEDLFQDAFQVNKSELFAPTVSTTFHGRDIMAPIAARLACGMDISQVGQRLLRTDCLQIPLPEVTFDDRTIIGEIVHIDHFGNLRTSIRREDIAAMPPGARLKALCCGQAIATFGTTYSDASNGGLIALFDSRDHLEIAVSGGSAALALGCRIGDRITITAED
jgi:S-adenosylmethionine hydrolase